MPELEVVDPYAPQGYQPPPTYQPYPRLLYRRVKGELEHVRVTSAEEQTAREGEGWTVAVPPEKGGKR